MGRMLVLVVVSVCACGGGQKPAEPADPPATGAEPVAKPEMAVADDPTACEIVVAHLFRLNVDAGMNPPSWAPDLLTRHCMLDGWSEDSRRCIASTVDPYEISDCCRRWTADQLQRVKDDLAAKGVVFVLVTPPPSNPR